METISGDRSAWEFSLPAVAREGVIGGIVGAITLAIWFLVTDAMAGRPLLTPALLGARVFQGASATADAVFPQPAALLIVGYTVVHGLAFVGAGLMIAQAMAIFERTPPLLIPGFFFLVVFFEFVYYAFVLAVVEPALGILNWPTLLFGNVIAVLAMASYFWRRHSDLIRRLVRG